MMMQSVLVLVVISIVLLVRVSAAPADPEPAIFTDPDGLATPALFLQGDEHFSWMSDEEGFTVVQDLRGYYVYADKKNDGRLTPSTKRVGFINPSTLKLEKSLKPDIDKRPDDALKSDEKPSKKAYERWKLSLPKKAETTPGFQPVSGEQRRQLWREPIAPLCDYNGNRTNPCVVKHLVVLVRFADHASRDLPTRTSYETLFNDENSESVKNFFKVNSHGALILDTHVTDWVQVARTEEYAVANEYNAATNKTTYYYGRNRGQTRQTWKEALEILEGQGFDFSAFDDDGDGYIDALTIVHSGPGKNLSV